MHGIKNVLSHRHPSFFEPFSWWPGFSSIPSHVLTFTTHTQSHTHTHTHTHMYIHTHTPTHTHVHPHTLVWGPFLCHHDKITTWEIMLANLWWSQQLLYPESHVLMIYCHFLQSSSHPLLLSSFHSLPLSSPTLLLSLSSSPPPEGVCVCVCVCVR